jgi:hypothetical protein
VADMYAKGRAVPPYTYKERPPRTPKPPRTKVYVAKPRKPIDERRYRNMQLTPDQVRLLRVRYYDDDWTVEQITEEFGISRWLVRAVLNRIRYDWVE